MSDHEKHDRVTMDGPVTGSPKCWEIPVHITVTYEIGAPEITCCDGNVPDEQDACAKRHGDHVVPNAEASRDLLLLRLARAEHGMRLVRSLRDEVARGDQTVTLSKRVFVSALNERFDRAERWMPDEARRA